MPCFRGFEDRTVFLKKPIDPAEYVPVTTPRNYGTTKISTGE
jgi:hypothetical protein